MYAIFRVDKIKTVSHIKAAAGHQDRTRETPNAEKKPGGVWPMHGPDDAAAEIIGRLPSKRRKDAVLCMDVFVSASPEYFRPEDPAAAGEYDEQRMIAWRDRTMRWLKKEYGSNLVSAHLHLDESTPHIQALVVPIDEHGGLNAKKLFNPKTLAKMQDRCAAAVADLGIQRGVKGSTATHQDVRRFYGIVNSPTPAPKTKVPLFSPPPKTDLIKQLFGVKTPHMHAVDEREAKIKKRFSEEQRQRQALSAKAKYSDPVRGERERLGETVADLRKVADQVRDIPLGQVFEQFGYQKDPKDPKFNWDGEMGRISTDRQNPSKFFNHDLDQGGGGAIDLAMHLGKWDFKTATSWLASRFGAGSAVGAAMYRAAAEAKAAADEPAPSLPVPRPTQSAKKIERVKRYLTEDRKLSPALVQWAFDKNRLFADDYANACFNLSGGGVELRGTGERPFHGVRGDEKGFFVFTTGAEIARTVYVESAIDALSYYELHPRKDLQIVSITGGAKKALQEHAQGEIEQGRMVVAGFDKDKAGDRYIEHLREVAMDDLVIDRPKYGKDWNEALRVEREPSTSEQDHDLR